MRERTTSELIETLGDDIDRCHRELIGSIDRGDVDPSGNVYADYEYHARQLIRAIFAFVEAVTFSIKVQAGDATGRLIGVARSSVCPSLVDTTYGSTR
jgi:hypothetical protein